MPRPRILILSAYYFPFQGGTETHARKIAVHLSRAGYAITVVAKRDDRGSPDVDRVDDVPVHRVRPAGVRSGPRKWLMLPFAFAKILALRDTFDVIYCPGYQGIGLAAIAAGWWLNRPVVLRSGNLGVLVGHQWDAPLRRFHVSPSLWPVRALKGAIRRVYMRAAVMVCNCRENETEALDCGLPRERVWYLPNAVNIDVFRPAVSDEQESVRRANQWPLDRRLLLYVGRLSAEKGVLELVEAWRTIDRTGWTLVLVGPDMGRHALDVGPRARQFVAEHGLGSSVIFHGEATDTATLLRAADLYVQPSHYESFSNALVEAMGTGLPVVATRVGGMLDCIVDAENGLFCRPGDAQDLAGTLQRLMNQPELARRLGERARATVVTDFNEDRLFKRFEALFDNLDLRASTSG